MNQKPKSADCDKCQMYGYCNMNTSDCFFKTDSDWQKHMQDNKNYDKESQAMYEHYHPKAPMTEDD